MIIWRFLFLGQMSCLVYVLGLNIQIQGIRFSLVIKANIYQYEGSNGKIAIPEKLEYLRGKSLFQQLSFDSYAELSLNEPIHNF